MIPISKTWLIQIEVTNACTHRCANCTRFVGHHRETYMMDLATVEKAIDSLEGYENGIGIMGGEPTLHPQFLEICALLRAKVPHYRCGLWTSGYKWEQYKDVIRKTFGEGVYYNDHSDPLQKHQPMLVAIDDVIRNKKLMWQLIDKCPYQRCWSPSINPRGGFFCEVAAALDLVFHGPGGYPIEKGWWNKTPEQFRDQVERYCVRCSGALPMIRPSNKDAKDLISQGNFEQLKVLGSPKVLQGNVEILDRCLDEEAIAKAKGWSPLTYLGSELRRKKKLKLNEFWLLIGFHGIRRRFNKLKWQMGIRPRI